jgi:hypothetical protein
MPRRLCSFDTQLTSFSLDSVTTLSPTTHLLRVKSTTFRVNDPLPYICIATSSPPFNVKSSITTCLLCRESPILLPHALSNWFCHRSHTISLRLWPSRPTPSLEGLLSN